MSSEYTKDCGCISNIKCEVENCIYHGAQNTCHAGHIEVKSSDAVSKDETLCSTFKLQG